jgi:RNA polymerase sigma factor (TIGR02999 family)
MELLRTTPLEFRSGTPLGWPSEAVSMNDVTRILSAIEQGDPQAAEQLLPLVYNELRKLAAQKLAQEKPGQTLQATALVHEAYLRLVDQDQARCWDSRGHFFAAAAEAMRRILVEQARRKKALRRGGRAVGQVLREDDRVSAPVSDEVLDLDEALRKFEAVDRQAAQVVKLRIFAGMTIEESAQALGVSTRTADRSWAYARAWLSRELGEYE